LTVRRNIASTGCPSSTKSTAFVMARPVSHTAVEVISVYQTNRFRLVNSGPPGMYATSAPPLGPVMKGQNHRFMSAPNR